MIGIFRYWSRNELPASGRGVTPAQNWSCGTDRTASVSQIPVRFSYGSGAVTKGLSHEPWRSVQLPTTVANLPASKLIRASSPGV
jgi:hypothetical protein